MIISMDRNSLLVTGNSYFDIVVTNQIQLIAGSNSRGDIQLGLGGVFNISRSLVQLEIEHGLYTSVGSPVNKENFWEFTKFDATKNVEKFLIPKIDFHRELMCTAVIEQNIERASRTSIVNNGISRNLLPRKDSSFSHQHISYIDNLPYFSANALSEMRSEGQFISVDLCLNDSTESEINLTIRKIQEVNLVVMSESEFAGLFLKECNLMNIESIPESIENLIVHGEGRIIIKTRGVLEEVLGRRKGSSKVLGLGDKFIAYFYASFLGGSDIACSARMAFWQLQKEVWSE